MTEISYKHNLLNAGISGEWVLIQNNLDKFEEATSGYFVVNLFTQYSFIFAENKSNISLNINNVLEQEFRNHLLRVKSILPEAGRNFRLLTNYSSIFRTRI